MTAVSKNSTRKYSWVLFAAFVFFVMYVVWQYMVYRQQGWDFVSWHTHLAPYVFLLLVWFSIRTACSKAGNWLLVALSVLTTLMVVEMLLTFLANGRLYDKYKCDTHNYYHTWPPNRLHYLANTEFKYERFTNSLGFADKEWDADKKTKKRLVALGDSFTEGDGASADSSFPVLLQQLLNKRVDSTKWEVLNAGTCGSDPVFDFEKLNGLLLPYQPDIVLQVISARDFISDIEKRGGFERFKPDSTIAYKPLPWWFYPAVLSNICQKIIEAIQYTGYSLHAGSHANHTKATEQELINRYITLAQSRSIKTIFVVLPYGPEVKAGKYNYRFAVLEGRLPVNVQIIDLLPAYKKWLAVNNKKVNDVYWAHDGHHNATGYQMMADCIAQQLQQAAILRVLYIH